MAGMYGCFKGRNSDGAAMASGPPDVTANQEPAEVQEECSGKKKSKFQTFKKFFARKKRKDPSAAGADAGLKASQSSDNVSKTSENNTLTRSEKEKGSGSKISLGSKALSHDSVFVSDSSEANEALGASQDSIHGKVKSLQLQLKQAIKLGSPPSLMCVKRTEDAGTMSEDDGLPCSPPEYTTLHTVMNQTQRTSSISLEGIDSDDDQLSCAASSRAVSPLVVPGDFSQPASPFVCLDNSAAKHKLGLRHKACNKRKPASRLEGKPEGDSVVEEMLTTSVLETETEALEKQPQRRIEDVIVDQLKPEVEGENEKEDEDEEKQKPQHIRESLLRDNEQREEEEDDSLAEQEVSHGLDTSCPPESSVSEEEASEPWPSSKPSSGASSMDSPRATPEPPAASRGYLLDSPGLSNEAEENKDESNSASEGEDDDGFQETREEEEESSFLQEVLSSLKTPLVSLDVETEGVVMEIKEEKEDEEKSEEVKGEEADKPVSYQAAPSSSVLSLQTTEEEKEADTPSYKEEEEVVVVEEEVNRGEDEPEEEKDLAVEQFSQHDNEEEGQKEEIVEAKPEEEEDDMFPRQTVSQAGKQGEEEESEEEEETELEKEPEVEKKREQHDYEEVEVEMNEGTGEEEAEEAMEEEEEEAEENFEMLPDGEGVELQSATPMQEEDEGVVLGDDTTKHTNDDDATPTELCDQELTLEQEAQENLNQNSDGEEGPEEDVEIDLMDQKSDQEKDTDANQPDVDQTEEDQEQESVEIISHLDIKEVEEEPSEATEQALDSSKPSSLSLLESHYETHSQDSGATSPSKTSTIHINLVSPSSEKTMSSFQLPQTDPSESVARSHDSTEADTSSVDEKPSDSVEEEDKQPTQEQEAASPTSVEETVNQPPSSLDQSKVRFTIAPAWQRSKSLTPPSSPPACISSFSAVTGPQSEEVETATKEDPVVKPEPANDEKVELVLSPGRLRNTGSTTAKPQNNATPVPVKPQISAAASTEESSVVVEGNPDNPFGVRLRKTSALLRISSEEENTEPSVESPTQPTSCKLESPPVSVKPSVPQPISNKPALPKKPDVTGDSGAKVKRVSDPAAGRGVSAGSESPSWISMAKQKQKIHKENSLEEITVKKEEQERKSSLPMYVSSAASKEQSNKPAESTGKVSPLEISKPSVSVEKDTRRALSPPAPVPPQPSKSQPLPCPVAPKPQLLPNMAKHPPQPTPLQRSPLTPVPVLPKSPSCTSPTPFSKTTSPSKTSPVTSPPFLPRTAPEKPATRPPGLSGQTPSSQRSLPSPALPQDEPPWMALAKKKAKAWSEMPQIVQ